MSLINLIFIGLIFFSLVVIMVIFGRNAKKLEGVSEEEIAKRKGDKNNFVFRAIGFIFTKIKHLFIFLAEWSVKKIKKFLHLIHFWLIKLKKGRKANGVAGEIEAKEELVMEEQQDLDRIIHDDLGQSEEEEYIAKQNGQEKEAVVVEENIVTSHASHEATQGAAKGADAEETTPVIEEEKPKLWQRVTARFKKEAEEEPAKIISQEPIEEYPYADGVVKVGTKDEFKDLAEEENMVQDVKEKRAPELDEDEELGVDRKILEKKILQKIAGDPKNVEHYRQLGELYIKMKDFNDALASYKFILKIKMRDADAQRKIQKINLLKRIKDKG